MTLFAGLVGQDWAVAQLRAAAAAPVHAYLLVGPAGVGKGQAARSFAASLLCADRGDGTCEACLRVLAANHPDVRVFERTGASMSVAEIDEIVRIASLTPTEADRQVLILQDLHLMDREYPRLLKTIEEPPPSTVFVMLAEDVPPQLVTIASRSVRIDVPAAPEAAVAAALEADGVDPERAGALAAAAGGRIDRARLLASDPGFAARQDLWRSVPGRLDGTGATVATLAAELLASVDALAEPLAARQAAELEALEAQAERYGTRFAKGDTVARHRREVRRVRTDELRSGLTTLAGVFRGRLAEAKAADVIALDALNAAGEALIRNPNEPLWLQALLLRLTPRAGVGNGP